MLLVLSCYVVMDGGSIGLLAFHDEKGLITLHLHSPRQTNTCFEIYLHKQYEIPENLHQVKPREYSPKIIAGKDSENEHHWLSEISSSSIAPLHISKAEKIPLSSFDYSELDKKMRDELPMKEHEELAHFAFWFMDRVRKRN